MIQYEYGSISTVACVWHEVSLIPHIIQPSYVFDYCKYIYKMIYEKSKAYILAIRYSFNEDCLLFVRRFNCIFPQVTHETIYLVKPLKRANTQN